MRTHVDKRADGVPLRALRVYKEPWAVNALVGLATCAPRATRAARAGFPW